jgi:predicted nucleic acid-binding protein
LSFLIDTNVVSELQKGARADPNVVAWFSGSAEKEIFLSALTLGEIRRGIENVRGRDRKFAAALETWLGRVADQHQERVLSVDRSIAEEWGRMAVPDRLPDVDGLLAATAKVHGLTLATRNVKDVERTGVSCVNPFELAEID